MPEMSSSKFCCANFLLQVLYVSRVMFLQLRVPRANALHQSCASARFSLQNTSRPLQKQIFFRINPGDWVVLVMMIQNVPGSPIGRPS